MEPADLPEWERLLSAERHLQALVPGTVLVGGTAAALHAGHRRSLAGDHVLEDLRPRFEEVLATLEAAAGWQTARVQKPVAIPGRLDGVMTGIRQLRRTRPLETEVVSGLRVPTLEMARIKAGLLATRQTVRNYLDAVVLLERLGEAATREAFSPFDEIYRQESGGRLDLESDEVLAQVLDRGDLEAWRELYRIASADATLRRRILGVVHRVALPYSGFWLAALASLGEPIDWAVSFLGTTAWPDFASSSHPFRTEG